MYIFNNSYISEDQNKKNITYIINSKQFNIINNLI